MYPTQPALWLRRIQLRYGSRFFVANRVFSTILYTLIFTIIAFILKRLIWEIYLLAPHAPEEAWMDPREQQLIVKYLKQNQSDSARQSSTMLEYGSGSSTFFYSDYVHRYVSIEHNLDYCRLLERMAENRPRHQIIISYMQSSSIGYEEIKRFERNVSPSSKNPSIQIYCIAPDFSMRYHRFLSFKRRSTYSMYRNYIDFVSVHLSNQMFDFVLIDGRARPQVAYVVLKHLNGPNARVFVHDWNARVGYWVISEEFYDVIDQQIESAQLGGGGLVVLTKKDGVFAGAKLNEIQWKKRKMPLWWL